jgi:hypothetical protein
MNNPLEWTEHELSMYNAIMRTGGFSRHLHSLCLYTWSYELTKLFIDHGANVNSVSSDERCADVNAIDHGWTVLDYLLDRESAPDRCHKNVVLLLMTYGATPVKTWKCDTLIREFYWDVRSFLVLVNTNFVLPIDVLRTLHAFIIG